MFIDVGIAIPFYLLSLNEKTTAITNGWVSQFAKS